MENIALGGAVLLTVIMVLAVDLRDRYFDHARPEPLDLTRNGGIADHPAGMMLIRTTQAIPGQRTRSGHRYTTAVLPSNQLLVVHRSADGGEPV